MVLTAWQLLLLIFGIEIISLPLVVFAVDSMIASWFRAKERHQEKLLKALGEVIKDFGKKIGGDSDDQRTTDN